MGIYLESLIAQLGQFTCSIFESNSIEMQNTFILHYESIGW